MSDLLDSLSRLKGHPAYVERPSKKSKIPDWNSPGMDYLNIRPNRNNMIQTDAFAIQVHIYMHFRWLSIEPINNE